MAHVFRDSLGATGRGRGKTRGGSKLEARKRAEGARGKTVGGALRGGAKGGGPAADMPRGRNPKRWRPL